MHTVMPDRHNKVKHKYACEAVAKLIAARDNGPMQQLKELRKRRKLSQAQLAEAVGCNQATIAKIERGEANPTLRMIEDIAAALNVSPVSLFGVSELQSRVIAALDALPDDRREAALIVLETMATQSR